MPLHRYRDVADVPPPAARAVADAATFRRIVAWSTFARRTAGPLFEPGLTRFASIEAAGAAREAALIARMRRLR